VAVFVALLRTAQISSDAHSHIFQLCERTLSFAVSLREEGEVAWLESPNGLGATAEFQLRGEVSRTKFPAILCRRSTSLGNERTDGNKAMVGCAALLIVENSSRCRFAQFNLRTDLLDLRGLLFQACGENFHTFLLLCHR